MSEEGNVRIDGLAGFKVEGDLLLFAFVGKNSADKKYEAVRWDAVVQFETLLGTGDGSKHRETIHARLDVRGSTVLLRQHSRDTRDLVLCASVAGRRASSAGDRLRSRHIGRTFGGMMRLIMEVPAL